MFDFPPRSLATRTLITVELTPHEVHRLIQVLDAEANRAADDADQVGYADFLFQQVAALREALR
jgi:hypothetical protein